MAEPLTDEQIAEIRVQAPVGFFCDHSDEPHTSSSHHAWGWVEGEGLVFQHEPNVFQALAGPKDYLGPERAAQRCSREVPVYAVDVPALGAEVERLRATARHMGGAIDALGEVIRSAVRTADAGDPAAAMRAIAAYAAEAGILDDLEPAGSPS